MAEHAGVPVVNALTDEFHPCQLLADLLTIRERKGELGGLTAAFVGDGACNMGNSWLLAGATAGLHVKIAAPEGHQPEEQYVARAREIGEVTGATARVMVDPEEAVAGADVVVTDTWVSMGKEEEAADRLAAFAGYRVTTGLMRLASLDAIAMHCLPAYRGKEIDSEVLDGPQSVVWDEAENRRHAQKAILTWLVRKNGDLEEVPL
jgi:ornithine carbamoyltransferase